MFIQERFDMGGCQCLIYSLKIASWSIFRGLRSLAAFLWRRGRLHAQAHVGGFIDVEEFAVWYSSFCFAEEAWGRTDRESEKVCLCVCVPSV